MRSYDIVCDRRIYPPDIDVLFAANSSNLPLFEGGEDTSDMHLPLIMFVMI